MTFSALTGPIRWVARLSARMLTALALMSLLLAPSAGHAAQPAPRPQAEQVAVSPAAAKHEAEPAPAAAPVLIGIIEPTLVVRTAANAVRPPASAHPRAQGSRAPPV
ncbi:hypothetical protein [Catellatospora chokoriensis]|uniref:Uncharacterized protein n=1 Tax=Catellatospora chokoriensis TaxID=310353 RepID=A0A8J3NPP7_9ACTN|nr:hypothetical protein [Catellatospora chokoriensis]GIF87403.1 hypothetical protein Cch02nite_08470 [Catellatospora chokoriensis]